MTKPYVQSGYARIDDDNYQTLDKRCVKALNDSVRLSSMICDCCSPNGSGIVSDLIELGYNAFGVPDAFQENIDAHWIVSNPPYKRPLVDDIINAQLARLNGGKVRAVAMLLRNNFSFAKTRWDMFEKNPYYAMEIKMAFRPWWSEDRSKQPIHNFVWHIWLTNKQNVDPIIRHWREE